MMTSSIKRSYTGNEATILSTVRHKRGILKNREFVLVYIRSVRACFYSLLISSGMLVLSSVWSVDCSWMIGMKMEERDEGVIWRLAPKLPNVISVVCKASSHAIARHQQPPSHYGSRTLANYISKFSSMAQETTTRIHTVSGNVNLPAHLSTQITTWWGS